MSAHVAVPAGGTTLELILTLDHAEEPADAGPDDYIRFGDNLVPGWTLSLLAVHVDRSFLSGELHRDGGVVFFLLALVLLVPVVLVLRRCDLTLHPRKGLQWLNSRFRFSIW